MSLVPGWQGLNIDRISLSRFYSVWENEEEGSIQGSRRFYIKKLQTKILKKTRVEDRYLYYYRCLKKYFEKKNKISPKSFSKFHRYLFQLIYSAFYERSNNKILWWPIAAIEKKLSKSRENFHNREKPFRIKKKILESRKTKL